MNTNRKQNRIAAKIADAVESLRTADAKLAMALDDYDDEGAFERIELLSAQFTARVFANILDEQTGTTSSLPHRVFRIIEGHENELYRNVPHIEGVIIALELAERSLESALDLADQFDGAVDAAYEKPLAALNVVNQLFTDLNCQAFVFDYEAALDEILDSKPTLAFAS